MLSSGKDSSGPPATRSGGHRAIVASSRSASRARSWATRCSGRPSIACFATAHATPASTFETHASAMSVSRTTVRRPSRSTREDVGGPWPAASCSTAQAVPAWWVGASGGPSRATGPARLSVSGAPPRGWELPDETHTVVETYDEGWMWSVPISPTTRHVGAMVDRAAPSGAGSGALATHLPRGNREGLQSRTVARRRDAAAGMGL